MSPNAPRAPRFVIDGYTVQPKTYRPVDGSKPFDAYELTISGAGWRLGALPIVVRFDGARVTPLTVQANGDLTCILWDVPPDGARVTVSQFGHVAEAPLPFRRSMIRRSKAASAKRPATKRRRGRR